MTNEEFFERLLEDGMEHGCLIYAKPLYDYLSKHPSEFEGKTVVTVGDIIEERDRFCNLWNRAFSYWMRACDRYGLDPSATNKDWMDTAERIKDFVHDQWEAFDTSEWVKKV